MANSLFAGFNIAVRAMQNSQYAITVHSSNISNANDPSYTRRDVLPQSEQRISGPGIERIRDSFADDQYRVSAGALGSAQVRQNALSKAEDIFGDPVNGGLRTAIDQFYDAWQGLAENPSDGVARLQVISAGKTFAQQISSAYQQLTSVQTTATEQLTSDVDQVNSYLNKVFDLNKQISDLSRNGQSDADLRDQRDAALDKLATLTGASAIEQGDGTVKVVVGSTVVLDGPTIVKLNLSPGSNGPVPTWSGYPNPTYNGTGDIGGLVQVRDTDIAQMKQSVDDLGRAVATAVNTQHAAGFPPGGGTPKAFFQFTGAPADIIVNPNLAPEDIAAAGASTGLPADGDNARALAALADTASVTSPAVSGGALQSPRAFYRNLVGLVGTRASDAQLDVNISKAHNQVNEQERQSQSGVSVDEEVANLSMQQRAFQAAARVISVMDDMMDTLINRTGV